MGDKKVAIIQSNYIPWRGYFDNIAQVDSFVLYDEVQYTKRDWRNRNKIKTSEGLKWLSIPVEVKGKYLQKINETKISNVNWFKNHLNILKQNYKKSSHFKEIYPYIENLYFLVAKYSTISEINFHFIKELCDFLQIEQKISFSSEYSMHKTGKTERLVDICKQLNATEYFSGPVAKAYINESIFQKAGIKVSYFDYSGYPVYQQLYGKFEPHVSILDLLFNEGKHARFFLNER